MKILEVIEAKRWINTKTGRTASIYGAVPYTSKEDEANWQIEVIGYTWRLSNGTIGLVRRPAKTYEEALKVMNEFNNVELGE